MKTFRNIGVSLALWAITASMAVMPVSAQTADTYQRNVDDYRSRYEKYQVKKNEFNQFGTYAAEEELISAAQAMLLARADVWLAYWDTYAGLVKQTPTLEPAAKEKMNNFYTEETVWLLHHKSVVAGQTRRDTLAAEAVNLNAKATLYEAAGSHSSALIYNGRIGGVVERLLALNQAADERVKSQTLREDIKIIKSRGLQVNKDRLETVRSLLKTHEEEHAKQFITHAQPLEQVKRDLAPKLTEARQLREVLEELTEGVEW